MGCRRVCEDLLQLGAAFATSLPSSLGAGGCERRDDNYNHKFLFYDMHSTVAAFGRTRCAGLLCVNLAWLEGGPSGARFVCLLMFARGFGSQTAGRRMRQTSLSPSATRCRGPMLAEEVVTAATAPLPSSPHAGASQLDELCTWDARSTIDE